MTPPLPLADAFPVFTEADWRAAIAKGRRRGGEAEPGAAPHGALYPRRIGARPVPGRQAGLPWRAVQRVHGGDAATIAAAVAEDAAAGATGAEIAFAGSRHPLAGPLPAADAPAIAEALAGVVPDNFELRIDSGGSAEAVAAFLKLATARAISLVFTFDPIGTLAAGPQPTPIGAVEPEEAASGIGHIVTTADGRLWHAGGANDEQELAATLATFVAHLRSVGAPQKIGVSLAADCDQFRTIAKFRAMRLLLARVGEVAGLGALPRVHAETAWRMMSRRDPEMNILRATSAAFGAAVGGADSITVLSFDALDRRADGSGQRLARNTQTILAEEAHLSRVADPAAGSGAIEALTAALAEAAWKRFQAIEAEGGIVAAIAAGSLTREIAEVREARIARVAARDFTMVGVNAYLPGEAAPAPIEVKRAPVGRAEPLRFKRLAEPFEGDLP